MNELSGESLALLAGALAVMLAWLLTPRVREFAIRHGVVDMPGERRVHKVPVPRLGGAAIVIALVATVAILYAAGGLQLDARLAGILLGALIVSAVGAFDDAFQMRALHKLVFQLLAASAAVALGVKIDFLSNPFGPNPIYLGWLAWPASIAWLVFITNTVNLIDGLDGLAAGVSAIAGTTMAFIALAWGQPAVAILCAGLAGACVGFLRYNFNPARIFMGDSGAYFLGFVLAGASVIGPFKTAAFVSILVPMLALGVPIADVLFAIVRRAVQHRPIFGADKGHIHHRLLERGMSHRNAVLVIYLMTFALSLLALLIARPS